jgi:hypothetical protein
VTRSVQGVAGVWPQYAFGAISFHEGGLAAFLIGK